MATSPPTERKRAVDLTNRTGTPRMNKGPGPFFRCNEGQVKSAGAGTDTTRGHGPRTGNQVFGEGP